MTKNEVLTAIAARVDLITETQLATLEANLRVQGWDDDEVREALRAARAINTEALRDFMARAEAFVESEGAEVIRSLAFTTASPERDITVH